MLDLTAILFTTILCVFVAARAVILDSKIPWFSQPRPEDAAGKPPPPETGWNRKGGRAASAARGGR